MEIRIFIACSEDSYIISSNNLLFEPYFNALCKYVDCWKAGKKYFVYFGIKHNLFYILKAISEFYSQYNITVYYEVL